MHRYQQRQISACLYDPVFDMNTPISMKSQSLISHLLHFLAENYRYMKKRSTDVLNLNFFFFQKFDLLVEKKLNCFFLIVKREFPMASMGCFSELQRWSLTSNSAKDVRSMLCFCASSFISSEGSSTRIMLSRSGVSLIRFSMALTFTFLSQTTVLISAEKNFV